MKYQKKRRKKKVASIPGGHRFNRREAAEYLGVGEGTLAKWASIGHPFIPYYRIGKKAIYLQDDLDAVFVENRVEEVAE